MSKNKFYVTTPIYYASGRPHLGHVYTSISADVIARWNRLLNKEVFFLTGTDEHGQKVEKKAKEENKSPIDYVNNIVKEFKEMSNFFNISNDYFIRTTYKEHKEFVQKVLQISFDNGDIYKADYEGLYCVDCEAYYKEADLIDDNICPIHKKEVSKTKEENYFFKLSKYQNFLLEYFEKNKDFVLPISRRNEILNRIKEGLEDISISRRKETLSWGIELPFDKEHVTYVWFDALFNYISGLEINNVFDTFWPADIQLIGKDILWFHAVYWPAFLKSVGYELPREIFAHGWWTVNGEKMGKSMGNVIDPFKVAKEFGVDEFRYFLLTVGNFGEDQDFSNEKFISKINNELANDFGNLVSRTHTMISKYFDGEIPIIDRNNLEKIDLDLIEKFNIFDDFDKLFQELSYNKAYDLLWSLIRDVNAYINQVEPWKENNKERLKVIINILSSSVLFFLKYIEPIMPEKAELILKQFNFGKDNNLEFNLIDKKIKISEKENLFKKYKIEDYISSKKDKKEEKNNKNKKDEKMENNTKKEGFESLNLVVGKIIDIEEHPDSDKMYVEKIDIGEEEPLQIVSGLKPYYSLEELKDKNVVVLKNLRPAKLRGIKSYGMILVSEDEENDKVGILMPKAEVGENLRLETGEIANCENRVKVEDFFEMDFKSDGENIYFNGKKVVLNNGEIKIDRKIKGIIC
jgi:methionyl-tRNA synthetase